jgi:hypothetical protein
MAASRSIFKPEAGFDAIMYEKNNQPLNCGAYVAIGKPVAW